MILELKNIEKSFGDKKVLQGVSFTAHSGKAFGLLGRNGAGKTTSIRILMDVFPADGVCPWIIKRWELDTCRRNGDCTPRS